MIEGGELVKYRRLGKCLQCGQCCCRHKIGLQMETDILRAEEASDVEHDWSGYEGWAIFFAQGIWWYFKTTIEGDPGLRCEQLSDEDKCGIWQDPEHFPPICRYWPFHPSAVIPGCGFSFEREEIR